MKSKSNLVYGLKKIVIAVLNKSYGLNRIRNLFRYLLEFTEYLEFAEIHFFLYLLDVIDYLEFAEIHFSFIS